MKISDIKMKTSDFYKSYKREIWYSILFFVYAASSFELFNRPLIGPVGSLKIPLDDKIPLIKELIIVYHTFMPMVIVSCLMVMNRSREEFWRMILVLFLSQTLGYLVYTFYQTYVPRYDTSKLGDDFFSWVLKLTYSIDGNYSGAPSLHVSNMLVSIIFITRSTYKLSTKIILNLYLSLIALTTVLVKQHVVLDIPAGLLHAVICYIIGSIIYNKYLRNKLIEKNILKEKAV